MHSRLGNKNISKKIFFYAAVFLVAVSAVFLFYFHSAVGDALWRRFHWSGAALFFNRDAKFALEIGNYYFNGGAYDLAKAKDAYAKAVAADDKILWGHYQLARIIFVKGDFVGALTEINKELEANPENLRSLYVRGLVYGYRSIDGDLEKAEADFRRFTDWAPGEWAGYNDLTWVLSKAGKYQDAKDAVKKAFQEIPDAGKNPWLWNGLGVAELNLKKYREAEASFANAKALAERLTTVDWQRAYPGNAAKSAADGLRAFKDAIEKNLLQARSKNIE